MLLGKRFMYFACRVYTCCRTPGADGVTHGLVPQGPCGAMRASQTSASWQVTRQLLGLMRQLQHKRSAWGTMQP